MCAAFVKHGFGYTSVRCVSATLEGRVGTVKLKGSFVRAAIPGGLPADRRNVAARVVPLF